MRSIIIILILVSATCLYGQSIRQTLVQPSINLNHKFGAGWKLNLMVESRGLTNVSRDMGHEFSGYSQQHADIALVASYRSGFNNSISGGYLMRAREGNNGHRVIQQFSVVDQREGIRWGYRLASDQTWTSGEDTEIRLRGRIGAEIPLSGLEVDPTEWYIKINNEYLNIWEGDEHDLEVRLTPTIGYEISGSNKVEVGLEYRVNGFLGDRTRHRYFFELGWFVSI